MKKAIAPVGCGCAPIVGLFLLALLGGMVMGAVGAEEAHRQAQAQAQVGNSTSVSIPPEYVADVQRAGNICPEITPGVIAAQIQAESAWDPNAVSSAGAQGLSQFIPSTWATEGKDGDGDGKADPYNPKDAIFSQGHYMCSLVQNIKDRQAQGRLQGDVLALSLAAYNAGLGAVDMARGIPVYEETVNYVAKIKKAAGEMEANPTGVPMSIATSAAVKSSLDWAYSIATNPNSFYQWGGEGPLGYDCSGLTQAFARKLGVELPHLADAQARLGQQISGEQAEPGDLIFWSKNGGQTWYHTAIYAGNWMMISANSPATGIQYEPVSQAPEDIIIYRRITQQGDTQ